MSVDFRKRLAKANDLEVPELWPEVRSRLHAGPVPLRTSVPGRRQRFVAAFAALAVFAVAGVFAWTALRPGSNSGNVGSSDAQAPPEWLVQQARRMATDNDDPTPTSARWVLTDSRTAAPAVGLSADQGNGNAEYLVALEGTFVANLAPRPAGTDAPTGTTLVFTLDPVTHQVNDVGVSNQTIDIPGLAPFDLAWTNPTLGGLTMLESATGPSGDQALLKGELGSQGGCLTVGGASGVFVVWPSGFGLTEQDGQTWVTDDSGRLVAKIGDTIEMGGGVTNLQDIQRTVPAGIPQSCQVQGADHYWFAGTPSLVTAS